MISNDSTRRRGFVMILVMVGMVVITSLIGMVAVTTIRHSRECRMERRLTQALFLCDAGLIRFIKELASDPSQSSAHWSLSLEEDQAEISVKVLKAKDSDTSRIEIQASIHGIDGSRIQRTKVYSYPLQIFSTENI